LSKTRTEETKGGYSQIRSLSQRDRTTQPHEISAQIAQHDSEVLAH
jgi:hypothetical protein